MMLTYFKEVFFSTTYDFYMLNFELFMYFFFIKTALVILIHILYILKTFVSTQINLIMIIFIFLQFFLLMTETKTEKKKSFKTII